MPQYWTCDKCGMTLRESSQWKHQKTNCNTVEGKCNKCLKVLSMRTLQEGNHRCKVDKLKKSKLLKEAWEDYKKVKGRRQLSRELKEEALKQGITLKELTEEEEFERELQKKHVESLKICIECNKYFHKLSRHTFYGVCLKCKTCVAADEMELDRTGEIKDYLLKRKRENERLYEEEEERRMKGLIVNDNVYPELRYKKFIELRKMLETREQVQLRKQLSKEDKFRNRKCIGLIAMNHYLSTFKFNQKESWEKIISHWDELHVGHKKSETQVFLEKYLKGETGMKESAYSYNYYELHKAATTPAQFENERYNSLRFPLEVQNALHYIEAHHHEELENVINRLKQVKNWKKDNSMNCQLITPAAEPRLINGKFELVNITGTFHSCEKMYKGPEGGIYTDKFVHSKEIKIIEHEEGKEFKDIPQVIIKQDREMRNRFNRVDDWAQSLIQSQIKKTTNDRNYNKMSDTNSIFVSACKVYSTEKEIQKLKPIYSRRGGFSGVIVGYQYPKSNTSQMSASTLDLSRIEANTCTFIGSNSISEFNERATELNLLNDFDNAKVSVDTINNMTESTLNDSVSLDEKIKMYSMILENLKKKKIEMNETINKRLTDL